jgi:hypothetical protein
MTKILNVRGQNYVPFEIEAAPNEHLGGACVARMTLNTDKTNPTAPAVPDAATLANQQSMYTTLHSNNVTGEDAWYVDPEAMRSVLNDLDQGPRSYVEYSYTDRDSLNKKLRYTIDTYEIPPAVLTGDGSYWVCVVGYSTDDANAVTGFYINDPGWDAGLPEKALILIDMWNDVYLRTPVRTSSPRWGGKFVSICDPEPESADVGTPARRIKRPGDRIIPADEVEGLIREGLEEQGLTEQPEIRAALERGKASTPHLVQVLDDIESPYYLVTYEPDGVSDQALAKVALDARYGDIMAVTAAEEPWTSRLRTRTDIHRAATDRVITIPRPISETRAQLLSSLAFDRGAAALEPGLFQAYRESMIEAALISARHPAERVILRPETTEVSEMMVATTAIPATILAPSYRVMSSNVTAYMRAYVSSAEATWYSEILWFLEPKPMGA